MKKLKINYGIKFLVMTIMCLLMLSSFRVEVQAAAPAKVTGLKQTGAYSNYIDVEWDKMDTDTSYEVEFSKDKVNWETKTAYSSKSSIGNLDVCSVYYIRVRGYNRVRDEETYSYVNEYGEYSDILECVTAPNQKVTGIKKTKSTTTSLDISWTAIEGATGYIVSYDTYSPKEEHKTVCVTGTKTTLKKLQKNSKYYVTVAPYKETSNKSFRAEGYKSDSVTLKVTPSKLKKLSPHLYDAISTFAITIEDKTNADKFQVQIYNAATNKKIKTIESASTYISLENKVFKKANVFKVRVRGYILDGKKKTYGEWSDWSYVSKEIKVKLKNTKSGIKLTWDKIAGADRYVIYASTKQKSGYKKVKTINKGSTTSCTISKIGNSKLKSGKKYYFYIIPYEKVGKKYVKTADSMFCYYITYQK